MANNNEEQQKTTAVKQEPLMEPKPNLAPPKTNNKSLLTTSALLIALGALGTSVYTLTQNQQLQQQLVAKHENLSSQLSQIEQKQEKDQEQINSKTNTLEETRSALQTKFDGLEKQLQSALSQKFYQNQNWQLLKARYYLELAQINAHWSDSDTASIALLQQADQLLSQLNDSQVLAIRQAIAKDIAKLQAHPQLDVAGILSQLDAAQNSLNDLNIPALLNDEKSEVSKPAPTSKESLPVWRLRLQDSMDVLSKLVIIRRNDENVKPLMSPAIEALLKENVRLSLQEAQWAVLTGNNKVYQLVLEQAQNMLKKNFNENAPNTAALLKKLQELQQIQLNPKKPELGSALPLLNEFITTQEPKLKESQEQGGKD